MSPEAQNRSRESLRPAWYGHEPRCRLRSPATERWRFTPEEGPEFFRPLGWEPAEVRSGWEEVRRLGRDNWLMRAAWTFTRGRRREPLRKLVQYELLAREGMPTSPASQP